MVGNNTQGDVLFLVLMILDAGYLHDVLHDVLNRIDLKEVVHALHYAGKALKTHTGVDILLLQLGIGNVVLVDRQGALCPGQDWMNPAQAEMAKVTNKDKKQGTLADVMKGADVFIGVSRPNLVSQDMVRSMNQGAIVFPMANPTPEIMPDEALAAGAAVVGTGRSDFPNQINNVLAFPGIFKGALAVMATDITESMKMAAAKAIASVVKPEQLTAQYILPQAFDPEVVQAVADAVAEDAKAHGLNRL